MKFLPAAIVTAAMCASPVSAAPKRCSGIVDGGKVRISPRIPSLDWMYEGETNRLPDVRTTVTCRIGKTLRLTHCVSPLADWRGRGLEREYTRHARVIDQRWRGCPLAGRSIRFNFRFETR